MDATITSLPAPIPTALALSDASVYGTQDVIGQVTTSGGYIAPTGTVVTLTSDSPSAIVPATVTIPPNQISAQFVIHTLAIGSQTNVTITASTGGASLAASFINKPPDIYLLWLSFTSVGGGRSVEGAVYLTSPAPPEGVLVQLNSSSPVAEIPATVTVPAGETAIPFTLITHEVPAPTTITFTATYNGLTQTTTLRVVPNIVTVSGTITLEGIDAGAPAQNVTLTFRPTDGKPSLDRVVSVGPGHQFSFADIPANNYTLHVHSDRYLDMNLTVNASNGSVTGLSPLLLAGDANSDNSVDVFDLDVLIQAFNSVNGDGSWNANSDLNQDGSVDIFDLDLIIRNFNKVGDE